ncbi:M20 family metallopeptidase [uncultured Brachyspira sp.]|uniref:M20 metallopeptidase family protein n=1 Tax=uncultured Brachyspira sp. TaxID=221953 RepID=UPI0025D829A5|nr:M20 family metallopeptidase [uncultured Brachyspira sp.]
MLKYNSKEILDYVIKCRRYLHTIPELGLDLPKTREFVINELDNFKNIKYTKNKKDSGIIAFINGKKKDNKDNKKIIALRADMDALPIKEDTDFEYKSCSNNMHACGHDAHTAILLGACKILNDNADEFSGTVRFLFQTGEEIGKGAKIMIEENALKDVNAIFAVHVGSFAPDTPNGVFIIQEGPIMASTDKIIIKIKGKGTHGAYPQAGIDPIIMSAEIINGLQSIITREIESSETVILSLCKISGGSAFNIIPDTVEIEGTIRTFNNDVRDFFIKRIKEKSKLISNSMLGECEIDIIEYACTTLNDAEITNNIKNTAETIFSKEAVWNKYYKPSMGGEDFSYYLREVKGCFALFSTITEKNIPNHNSKFEINEEKLNMPSELMANWAFDFLK